MGLWVRAVLSVALLAAVPAVLLLLLGGLVTAEILLVRDHHAIWTILIVPAAIALVRGLRMLMSTIDTSATGVPLTEQEQPDLWGLVRQLAVVADTQPPDEIYLYAAANAAVMEESRLLGLASVRRRMFIGAPLMAGLREDQLAAILTHELAHYSNRDTRLSGMAYRGRRAFVSTVSALNQDWFQKALAMLLAIFMNLYLRASTGLSRQQERAADEAAARAVGSGPAGSALRELAAISESWDLFMGNHLVWGWQAGYLPADAFGGYAEVRLAKSEELDRIRQNPPAESTPYDTHPPLTVRVAAIEAMAADPVVEVGRRDGVCLLRDAPAVLDAALLTGLVPEARDKRRTDWATLANVRGQTVKSSAAETMLASAATRTGGARTIRNLLDALDSGRVAELSDSRPPAGMGLRARRELARPSVRKGLSAVIQVALVAAGVARWEPRWQSGVQFVADEPYKSTFPSLVEAAIADRADTTGLRDLLDAVKVDLDQWRTDAVDLRR
jgi:Zn-dependent protease with chaperone function